MGIYSLKARHHQRVFISYRRADALDAARQVKRRLEQEQSPLPVFLDESSLKPVERFTDQLQKALDEAAILVVLVSGYWNTDEGRRRIHDPDDVVRREIVFATRTKKVLIPVLLDGVRMPAGATLPDDVRHIAAMQALPIAAVDGDTLHALVKEHSAVRKGGAIYTGLPIPPTVLVAVNATNGLRDAPGTQWYGDWECRTDQGGKSLTLRFDLGPHKPGLFAGTYAESRRLLPARERPMQGEWAMVVDRDSQLLLGVLLRFTVDAEAYQVMVPFHQRVGDAVVGTDPQGNRYVTRNLRPVGQGL
jgi:hypothetical protein